MKGKDSEMKGTYAGLASAEMLSKKPDIADGHEPLADEPNVLPAGIATPEEDELGEADSVATYIALVQAEVNPPVPQAGPSLAEQLARFTAVNTDVLAALLGSETE